mgnify:CR=1 FL=1
MKFLLVLKVCSALDGTCIPEKNVDTYDSWYNCARQGTVETLMLLDSIGEDLINKNKLFVAFSCKITNET